MAAPYAGGFWFLDSVSPKWWGFPRNRRSATIGFCSSRRWRICLSSTFRERTSKSARPRCSMRISWCSACGRATRGALSCSTACFCPSRWIRSMRRAVNTERWLRWRAIAPRKPVSARISASTRQIPRAMRRRGSWAIQCICARIPKRAKRCFRGSRTRTNRRLWKRRRKSARLPKSCRSES